MERSWPEIHQSWQRDGFARLGPVLTPAEADALGQELESVASRAPDGPNPYGTLVHNVWTESPGCAALIHSGRLDALMRQLLDVPGLLLFHDLLIWKQPGNQSELMWHQDYSYWPLEPTVGVALWIALDDAEVANGCMHYLPGSHRLGERRPATFAGGGDLDERVAALPPLDLERARRDARAVPVRAGEAIVHHPLVWHMSPVNTSERHRRAWSTVWVSPASRWDPSHAVHPFNYTLNPEPGTLVSGELFPVFPVQQPDSEP